MQKMEDWKKNLGELLNEHRYFPCDEWNKQIDVWSQEWIAELNRRTGVKASFQLTSNGKKVVVSFDQEPEFIIYLKYMFSNEVNLKVNYTTKHLPLRKFKATINGEEILTLEDGPLLEKGFVLQTLTIALRDWLERRQ